jgi:hypothetical protein
MLEAPSNKGIAQLGGVGHKLRAIGRVRPRAARWQLKDYKMRIVFSILKKSTRLVGGFIGFGLTILSLPFSLLAAAFPQGEPSMPAWEIIGSVVGIGALFGTGFVMFSLGWPKRFANLNFRCATFLFLLFSLVVGCVLIQASRTQFPPVGLAIVLVAFISWLLLLCIKPNLLEYQHKIN